jgi:hypothetical protein
MLRGRITDVRLPFPWLFARAERVSILQNIVPKGYQEA